MIGGPCLFDGSEVSSPLAIDDNVVAAVRHPGHAGDFPAVDLDVFSRASHGSRLPGTKAKQGRRECSTRLDLVRCLVQNRMERWLSGLKQRFAKPSYWVIPVPGVRIPPSPFPERRGSQVLTPQELANRVPICAPPLSRFRPGPRPPRLPFQWAAKQGADGAALAAPSPTAAPSMGAIKPATMTDTHSINSHVELSCMMSLLWPPSQRPLTD